MIGMDYIARLPEFARALAANDVLCRISAPSTGILLVKRATLWQRLAHNLNEVNAIGFCRLSTDGSSGAAMTFEETNEFAAAFPGSGAGMDADGWTQPTVSGNVFRVSQFNLANGYEWARQDEDDYILVPPSGRIGLRLLTAPSASMTWNLELDLLYLGA